MDGRIIDAMAHTLMKDATGLDWEEATPHARHQWTEIAAHAYAAIQPLLPKEGKHNCTRCGEPDLLVDGLCRGCWEHEHDMDDDFSPLHG